MPSVVMISPRLPGEREEEGYFEEGEARCVKSEVSIMWTWRGEFVRLAAQLAESVRDDYENQRRRNAACSISRAEVKERFLLHVSLDAEVRKQINVWDGSFAKCMRR